ncbi:hypothetical protein Tsubulata_008643 [Turnera subulata]|uniref:DUF4283 domain-containing protein n=1 Tax=Turnera subulata TaxID=218843 RepID=A0A9Q0FIZ7_9ROSI|nr:hypothetical protein Tsubulata_008643 [Turnera subulata]
MAGTDATNSVAVDQGDDDNTLVIRLRPTQPPAPKPSLILIGKLWSEKNFNCKTLMQTMSSLWLAKKGLQVSELEKNLFMFKFMDERDKTKILLGEPWHFDRYVLVLQAIEGNKQPSSINLHHTLFGIQIFDLPFDYRESEIARMIGKKLGFLMDVLKDCGYESDEEHEGEAAPKFGEELRAPPFRKGFSISKSPVILGNGRAPSTQQPSQITVHPATKSQYGKEGDLNVTNLVAQFASMTSTKSTAMPSKETTEINALISNLNVSNIAMAHPHSRTHSLVPSPPFST